MSCESISDVIDELLQVLQQESFGTVQEFLMWLQLKSSTYKRNVLLIGKCFLN